MRNDRFLKRLTKELPLWIERGWVKAGDEKAIFDHVPTQGEKRTQPV